MKRFISLTCFVTFSVLVSAQQYDNYKLEDYVNPNYNRKALDFNLNLAGDIKSNKRTGYYIGDEDNDRQSFSGDLDLGFNNKKNTLNYQGSTAARLKLGGYYSHDNSIPSSTDLVYNRNKMGGIQFDYNQSAYYYTNKQNRRFIEFSPSVSFGYSQSIQKINTSDNPLKSNNKELSTFIAFNLGIGNGRIENVEDARQAVYILEELQKTKVINKTLSDEEVNAFARVLTEAKNKRQFDSRTKLIQEISKADSFLIANGYVEKDAGAPYFTTLYDNWLYAGLIERKSGSRFSVGLTPHYYFHELNFSGSSSSGTETNSDYYSSSIAAALYFNYTYEKPINLYWQRSAGANLNVETGKYRNKDSNYFNPNTNVYYSMGYYPNSRTYFTGRVSESVYWDKSDYGESVNSDTRFSFDMYYYLSPQLRISGNYNLSFSYNRDIKNDVTAMNKYPNNTFSIGLIYSIF